MATVRLRPDSRIKLAGVSHFRLGEAEVRPSLLQIYSPKRNVLVEPRVMQMLVALHRADGAPMSRENLISECWDGLAVSDDAITQCISKLRRALSDLDSVQIESVPRVGYRLLVAPNAEARDQPSGAIDRRSMLVAGALLAGAAGITGLLATRSRHAGTVETVAVLPFANLSTGDRDDYFGDGLAEEVRSSLARLTGLKVIGRTSSDAIRNLDAKTVARRLGVNGVLVGSVRRSPAVVRVAVQLVDGTTGIERWSKTYDLAVGDALRLQSEIAESVALALSIKLGQAERLALIQAGTRNAPALDLYLQAKHAFATGDTEATLRQVIALCDAAIGLDPSYAKALALKAMALDGISGSFATDPETLRDGYAQGAAAAQRAIAIAPELGLAHVALARSLSGRLQLRAALEQYRMAERVAAGDTGVLFPMAQTLAEVGRTKEGLAVAERLTKLDPLNAYAFGMEGFALFYARRFGDALGALNKALEIAPAIMQHRALLGDCLSLLGRFSDAHAAYAQLRADDVYRVTGEAILAARTGDRDRSAQLLKRLTQSYEPAAYQRAQVHAQRGEIDEAFAELQRATLILDPGLTALPADPFIDALRPIPQFASLLNKIGFPNGH